MKKSLLVLFSFFVAFQVFPVSLFAPDSLVTEGSKYRTVEASASEFISTLPKTVSETSGLIFWRNSLWTHNDSGGKPEIYKIDTASGKITQTVFLDGVINFDWEDIAQDEDFIFVGDFGNNGGDRKNLSIYKIPKAAISLTEKVDSVSPSTIRFSFADQKSFENNFRKNDFDCESFLSLGDSLFLFTKNWVDGNSRLYVLPKTDGEHSVWPRTTFHADGLVTGADVNPAQNEVALIGYMDFQPFMWLFWDFEGSDFFGGQKLRIDFPDLIFVQTEGIAYLDDDKIVYSFERSIVDAGVFTVSSSGLKSLADKPAGADHSSKIVISDFPETFSGKIMFDVIEVPTTRFSVGLSDRKGKKLYSEKFTVENSGSPYPVIIPAEKLRSGNYAIKIISGGQSLVRKVKIKN
jgi:hypothetical protein